jgi:hypothetical protein
MTTIGTTAPSTRTVPLSTGVKAGLALSILVQAFNISFIWLDIDWGDTTPPTWLLVVQGIFGLISIIAAAVAWRTGSRLAIRVDAAFLILNGVTTAPGLFGDVTSFVKLLTAIIVLATVLALMLMMRRDRDPVAVND